MTQTQTEDLNYLLQLSDNMGNSKTELLSYIEYFYGKKNEEYEDAEFLIQSDKDIDMWIECWTGSPDEIREANWKLREWKVWERMNDGFDAFNDLIGIDTEDFVTTYFVQRSSRRVMWELNRLLGEMSVRELWEIHRKFPMARIEYLG